VLKPNHNNNNKEIIIQRQFIRRSNMARVATRAPFNSCQWHAVFFVKFESKRSTRHTSILISLKIFHAWCHATLSIYCAFSCRCDIDKNYNISIKTLKNAKHLGQNIFTWISVMGWCRVNSYFAKANWWMNERYDYLHLFYPSRSHVARMYNVTHRIFDNLLIWYYSVSFTLSILTENSIYA